MICVQNPWPWQLGLFRGRLPGQRGNWRGLSSGETCRSPWPLSGGHVCPSSPTGLWDARGGAMWKHHYLLNHTGFYQPCLCLFVP